MKYTAFRCVLVSVILCCILGSCTTVYYGTFTELTFEPKPPDYVMRLLESDTTAQYDKICIIAIKGTNGISRKQYEEELKKEARAVGADIVIRTEFVKEFNLFTGIAVRFIK